MFAIIQNIITFATSINAISPMKKAIALFLLSIMTLTALQPTVAMHFCGGNLRSVTIGKIPQTCCQATIENRIKTSQTNTEKRIYQPINTCCATYMVELSTDNFQSPVQQSAIDFQQHTFNPVLFSIDILLKGAGSVVSSSSMHLFPPDGLARYCADLLTVICIFRI